MENLDDKVLVCRNPECGRDSCGLCQEPNHVPLWCDGVREKAEEEERKKIEQQLSAAMMRDWRMLNIDLSYYHLRKKRMLVTLNICLLIKIIWVWMTDQCLSMVHIISSLSRHLFTHSSYTPLLTVKR